MVNGLSILKILSKIKFVDQKTMISRLASFALLKLACEWFASYFSQVFEHQRKQRFKLSLVSSIAVYHLRYRDLLIAGTLCLFPCATLHCVFVSAR